MHKRISKVSLLLAAVAVGQLICLGCNGSVGQPSTTRTAASLPSTLYLIELEPANYCPVDDTGEAGIDGSPLEDGNGEQTSGDDDYSGDDYWTDDSGSGDYDYGDYDYGDYDYGDYDYGDYDYGDYDYGDYDYGDYDEEGYDWGDDDFYGSSVSGCYRIKETGQIVRIDTGNGYTSNSAAEVLRPFWMSGGGGTLVALAAAPVPGARLVVIGGIVVIGAAYLYSQYKTEIDDFLFKKTGSSSVDSSIEETDSQSTPQDPCDEHRNKIYNRMKTLEKRFCDLLLDQHGLFTNAYYSPSSTVGVQYGSWRGHIQQYEDTQRGLRNDVNASQVDMCWYNYSYKTTSLADTWSYRSAPSAPNPSDSRCTNFWNGTSSLQNPV